MPTVPAAMPLSWRSTTKKRTPADQRPALAHQILDHGQAILGNAEAAAMADDQRPAEQTADQVADIVACDRRQEGGQRHAVDVHLTETGKTGCNDDERFAGKRQTQASRKTSTKRPGSP